MSIFERVRSMVTKQKSIVGPSGIPTSWPSNFFQYGYKPLSQNGGSVVEACVAAYAQTTAQLPGRHYRIAKDGTKTYDMTSNVARVLAKPNPFQTRSDFLLNLVYSLLLNGNAYYIGNGKNTEALYLLDPNSTQPHRVQGSDEIFYSTGGDFLDIAGADIEGRTMIPERFIGHVRLHTPSDPLIGVTPLTNAAASVSANESIVSHQASFFANMSRPSGMLTTDIDLNKAQMDQLREAWNDHSKGLNSGGVPILGSGITWQPLSINSQDAQLIEAWRMTVEDISRVFRVPPMLINNMENAAFNNAETLMRFWLASGLGFLINHIELSLASYFKMDNLNEGVELDQEVLLRADLQGQMEALGTGVTKGLMAPNEGRAKVGLGPVEGGDMPLVQQQMIPINIAATGAGIQNNSSSQISDDQSDDGDEPATPETQENSLTIIGINDAETLLFSMVDDVIAKGLSDAA